MFLVAEEAWHAQAQQEVVSLLASPYALLLSVLSEHLLFIAREKRLCHEQCDMKWPERKMMGKGNFE